MPSNYKRDIVEVHRGQKQPDGSFVVTTTYKDGELPSQTKDFTDADGNVTTVHYDYIGNEWVDPSKPVPVAPFPELSESPEPVSPEKPAETESVSDEAVSEPEG